MSLHFVNLKKKHHDITIFMDHSSRMSELAKEYFRSIGLDFDAQYVDVNKAAYAKMIQLSGQKETPVVILDGRMIIGYQPGIYTLVLEGHYDDTEPVVELNKNIEE